MNIYIDESGSFVSAPTKGSWNVVVAVTIPEPTRKAVERLIKALKISTSTHYTDEIKLNGLTELQYLAFLSDLSTTNVLLFVTATDAGLNTPDLLVEHQRIQVAKIRENLPKMKYEGGRQGVALLASQLEALPSQLYAQLICQVNLLHDVVSRAITYFAQRVPATLREFRWRIDQKNTSRTAYENAFEKIAPALLQTRSFREPLIRVRGIDYRQFAQYELEKGHLPEYLETEYGIRVEHGINIQKLIRGNLCFEDSKTSIGVQVADLLASGLRRSLRRGFADNESVAKALGRIMLENANGKPPIDLISFANTELVDSDTARLVKMMGRECRAMLTRESHANSDA